MIEVLSVEVMPCKLAVVVVMVVAMRHRCGHGVVMFNVVYFITRLLFDGRRAVKSPMVGGADQLRRSCLPTRALLALA